MTNKRADWKYASGTRVLTRRDALAMGAVAATSLYFPGGLIRSASAQTVSFDYYIGPNGNDSNPGTLSQPWAITAINTKRSTYASKRVGLLDGTYGLISIMGQPLESSGHSQRARLQIAGGSAASPTVVAAVNPRQAIIDWQRSNQSNGSMESTFSPAGNYVTIDGLVFDNNNYQCIVNNPGGGSGHNYLTVKNCWFRNQSYTGGGGNNSAMVYSEGGDSILISNCRFDGGSAPNDGNRHNAIMFYTPTVNAVIEYCTIVSEANGSDGIHWKQQGATDSTVRYCYINRSAIASGSNRGYAFKFEGVSDTGDLTTIHNNIIITGGATSSSPFHAEPGTAGTYDIHDNTFVGPWNSDGGISGVYSRAPVQFNCYRNIFNRVSGTGGAYGDVNVYSIGTIGEMNYNYYPLSPKITVGNSTSGYTNLPAWQLASGKDINSIIGGDPLFAASGTESALYQLLATSLCKILGPNLTEIGAWRGASQVGCSFGGGVVLKAPEAPQIISVG